MAIGFSPTFSAITMPVLLGEMDVKIFNHVLEGPDDWQRMTSHPVFSRPHAQTFPPGDDDNLTRSELSFKVTDPYKLGQRNRHRIKCPFVHMLDRVERCDVKVGQFLCSLSSKSQHTQTYLRLGARWGYRTPACWLARLFLQGLRVWLMRNLSQQQWKTWDWYIY